MKIARILSLIVVATMLASGLHAQERHLYKKISLSVTSVPIEDALASIAREGDFTFSYNSDVIDPSRRVTVKAENRNVDAVLTDLLGEKVRRKEVGNHVILVMGHTREEGLPKTEVTVAGRVTEAGTGRPLIYATVYEVGGKRSAVTNRNGQYSMVFQLGVKMQSLSFCKSGYRDTVVFVSAGADRTLNVTLQRTVPDILPLPLQQGVVPLPEMSAGELRIDSIALVSAFVPKKLRINSINLRIFNTWPVQFSLVPYLSTNWKVAGSVSNAFSLNLLVGYNGGVRGAEIGGLLNIDRNNMKGCQAGGLGNIVGQKTSGAQIGGLFNVNIGKVYGAQIGGLFNWAGDTLRGAQIAGLLNVVPAWWKGAQIAGLANFSGDHVRGFQLAGLTNLSTGDLRGVQVAGLVNYAKKLNGVQVGVFNVAASAGTGVQVGFLSYVHKGGYLKAEVSGDEVFYLNVAFKTGTKHLYNILKAGANDSLLLNFAWGLGTMFDVGKRFGFNIDMTAGMFFNSLEAMSWYGAQIKLAPAFEWRAAKHFSVFLGPALNYCFYSDAGQEALPGGLPFYTLYDGYHSGNRQQMWIGGVLGFRI